MRKLDAGGERPQRPHHPEVPTVSTRPPVQAYLGDHVPGRASENSSEP